MRFVVLVLSGACAALETERVVSLADKGFPKISRFCNEYKDVTADFQAATTSFVVTLFRTAVESGHYHLVYSPLSIWRILAALAEGADVIPQQQLFKLLNLPNDPCTRQKYYHLASQRIKPGSDVTITSMRTLVVDEGLKMNYYWLDFVSKHSLLDVVAATIKKYPQIAANHIRRIMSAPLPKLNLNGNSVILDSAAYKGLWTTAFSDAVIERSPFYDLSGRKIGSVDLMTMKRRVRMAYIPSLQLKVLELPAGVNGRYRLQFGLLLGRDFGPVLNNMMSGTTGIQELLEDSHVPLDVAIPQFTMISDIDVRSILEDAGISSLWTNPAATKFVSKPATLPSTFVQRTTLKLSKEGLRPAPVAHEPSHNSSTGLNAILGRDFVANRPFLFALLDAETYTCLMAAVYTQPTYTY